MASTLLACLELARDGKVELQQMAPFADIFVRDRMVGDREGMAQAAPEAPGGA